jgi:hypothetical protein
VALHWQPDNSDPFAEFMPERPVVTRERGARQHLPSPPAPMAVPAEQVVDIMLLVAATVVISGFLFLLRLFGG